MNDQKEKQEKKRERITIALPPELAKALRKEAGTGARNNLSKLVRDRLEAAVADNGATLRADEFWQILALISAIFGKLRLAKFEDDEHFETARSLYELALERCIHLDCVEP